MGDEEHSTIVLFQGLQKYILGVDVQVVCGLVQHQQVGRMQQHLQERYPVLLAAAQHRDRLVDIVAPEQESAQQVPHLGDKVGGGCILHLLKNSFIIIQRGLEILGEILYLHIGAVADRAGKVLVHPGYDAHKGGLTCPVLSYKHNLLAPVCKEIQVVYDMVVAIGLAHVGKNKHIVAGMGRSREGEMHLLKTFGYLDTGQGLKVLDPALDLLCLGGLVAEPADEEFNPGYLLLLLLVAVDKRFKLLAPPLLVLGVVALVPVHPAVKKLVYFVYCGVQERAVVGYNDYPAIV